MRRLLKRIYTLPVFMGLGRPLFAMARVSWLEPVSLRLARIYAWTVHTTLGRRRRETAAELAEEWHRLMPRPQTLFPVLRVEEDTAFVEIRVHCPLRGKGDAEACWRAMAFDRALMEASGGSLVVMASQSVSGEACCRLAIRPAGRDFDDLPVAHPRWRA